MNLHFMHMIRRRSAGSINQKWQHHIQRERDTLMVADFVSADYGWLHSPDGTESMHVLFHAGKGHDGYFDNNNICSQATCAMDILREHYPHEDHILIFDNATTHLKCAEGSLSASKMPKGPSDKFFVEVNVM